MNVILWILLTISLQSLLLSSHFLNYGSFWFIWCLLCLGAVLSSVFIFTGVQWMYEYLSQFRVEFRKKAVLITGCDSGFGLLLAHRLVRAGYHVISTVLDLSSEGAYELREFGSRVTVVKMDVAQEEDVDRVRKEVEKRLTSLELDLWAVVNNAGVGHLQLLQFTDPGVVENLFKINCMGTLRMCQSFCSLLHVAGGGRIVNVTSLAGIVTAPFFGGYAISKFGAEALSQILRTELRPLGITVITIQPDIYKTPMIRQKKELKMERENWVYGATFMQEARVKLQQIFEAANPNLHEVIDTMEAAITSRFPRDSYVPSTNSQLLLLARRVLGEWFMTRWGLRRFMGDSEVPSPSSN